MLACLSMKLELQRITFFVENLAGTTEFYRCALGLVANDIREGWAGFAGSGGVEIAFHSGKGRRPRLEFTTANDLGETREYLNERGARLGPIKEVRGRQVCLGKDRDGNSIQVSRA